MSSVEAAALPVRDTLRLVAFSHSVFALPFALISAWVAAGGMPDLWTLSGIVVCAVAARTVTSAPTSRARAATASADRFHVAR